MKNIFLIRRDSRCVLLLFSDWSSSNLPESSSSSFPIPIPMWQIEDRTRSTDRLTMCDWLCIPRRHHNFVEEFLVKHVPADCFRLQLYITSIDKLENKERNRHHSVEDEFPYKKKSSIKRACTRSGSVWGQTKTYLTLHCHWARTNEGIQEPTITRVVLFI